MSCTNSSREYAVGFLHIREFEANERNCGEPHEHETDHVTMCVRGSGTVHLDGVAVPMSAGDMVNVPKTAAHGIDMDAGSLWRCMFFRDETSTVAYDGYSVGHHAQRGS